MNKTRLPIVMYNKRKGSIEELLYMRNYALESASARIPELKTLKEVKNFYLDIIELKFSKKFADNIRLILLELFDYSLPIGQIEDLDRDVKLVTTAILSTSVSLRDKKLSEEEILVIVSDLMQSSQILTDRLWFSQKVYIDEVLGPEAPGPSA